MNYLALEGAMRSTVWVDLPAYRVVNGASEALLYLGLLGVRTTRAAMAVVAAGYEAESMTYKRALMEVHSRARRVVDDESGSYAKEWLRGRAGKPAKAVGGFSPDDLWDMLSNSSHADHRAVENFLAISNDDGSTSLLLHPERRPEVSNPTLAMFASEARDIAALVASENGLTIPHLDQLDAAIREHLPADEDEPGDASEAV